MRGTYHENISKSAVVISMSLVHTVLLMTYQLCTRMTYLPKERKKYFREVQINM